jgi:hypothetical protein
VYAPVLATSVRARVLAHRPGLYPVPYLVTDVVPASADNGYVHHGPVIAADRAGSHDKHYRRITGT